MKAAIISAPGSAPVYGEFREPAVSPEMDIVAVSASPLSQFSKSRSSGARYSSDAVFPSVAGAEGVGRAPDGGRVYFVLPEAPFGALAEKSLVRSARCVAIPDTLEDIPRLRLRIPVCLPGQPSSSALNCSRDQGGTSFRHR